MTKESSKNTKLESLVESIAVNVVELRGKVDALSGLERKVDALSGLERKVDALSGLEGKVDTLLGLERKVDELSGLQGKIDALSGLERKVDALAANLAEFQDETRGNFKDVRHDIADLKKGALTEREKDELLAMSRHYNERLEKDVLGKESITLTRKEYDATAKAAGFDNRFEMEPVLE